MNGVSKPNLILGLTLHCYAYIAFITDLVNPSLHNFNDIVWRRTVIYSKLTFSGWLSLLKSNQDLRSKHEVVQYMYSLKCIFETDTDLVTMNHIENINYG